MSIDGTMHALFAYHVSIRLRQICRRSRLHETRLDRLKCGCEAPPDIFRGICTKPTRSWEAERLAAIIFLLRGPAGSW
jgi:hypothetical protein